MRKAAFGLALWLAFASGASAQTVRATEEWYGLYNVEAVRTVEDPSVPGGQRRIGGKIEKPQTNSTRIPHTPGSYFGFGYVLNGPPSSEIIVIRHLQLIPPPGITDNTGKAHDRLDRMLNLSTGRDLFIGLSMGDRTPLGIWTFQVWHGDRVLLERKFEVYKR